MARTTTGTTFRTPTTDGKVCSARSPAPALYPPDDNHIESDRKQYYLKDWPAATRGSLMLDNGRRAVESILNSAFESERSPIAPWIAPTNTLFGSYRILQ